MICKDIGWCLGVCIPCHYGAVATFSIEKPRPKQAELLYSIHNLGDDWSLNSMDAFINAAVLDQYLLHTFLILWYFPKLGQGEPLSSKYWIGMEVSNFFVIPLPDWNIEQLIFQDYNTWPVLTWLGKIFVYRKGVESYWSSIEVFRESFIKTLVLSQINNWKKISI